MKKTSVKLVGIEFHGARHCQDDISLDSGAMQGIPIFSFLRSILPRSTKIAKGDANRSTPSDIAKTPPTPSLRDPLSIAFGV
jgi:hypothetical protein